MDSAPALSILLLGGSGRVGRFAAADLLARGFKVRAMVRDPAAAREHLPGAVELVAGDLRSDADVARAVQGMEGVIFSAAATNLSGIVPKEVDFEGVSRTAEAAKAAGVRLIILVSSAAVTQVEHPHNCTFRSILKWKLQGEDALRASGAPYVIVRALGLRDREGGQQGIRILQGDRLAFGEDIARADVATFLADVAAALLAEPGAPAPASFDQGFDPRSMLGATCEIYGTGSIAAGAYASAQPRLTPDPPVSRMSPP